ncbi:MAG: efflux RND transporter periplasmic adaptor subunit [Beijerinckiaceae bacterium]|nr:efflux RND transporter periplasmic adaptor subunit [Beijerinckiaceae bacterium]
MDESTQTRIERVPGLPAVAARGVVADTPAATVNARVSGVIQALDCDVNMQVKANQLCAKIDPRPYQIAVDQAAARLLAAEALLQKAKADLEKAKAAFERQKGGAKERTISRKESDRLRKSFEMAQARTNRAEAKVAEVEAALHAAETNFGFTNIISPVNGMVISRSAELGQTVAVNSKAPPLFVIAADLSLVQIHATVSAKDSRKIKPGDKVSFTAEAIPDFTFSGTVTEIELSLQDSAGASTANVIISTPNPDLLLKPGMPVMIKITAE